MNTFVKVIISLRHWLCQEKRSYFWYWCGCEVKIRGRLPTFCSPYQLTPNPSIQSFSLALQQAVAVLRNDSADLAG